MTRAGSWAKHTLSVALVVGLASGCASPSEPVSQEQTTSSSTPSSTQPVDQVVPEVDAAYVGTGPTVAILGDSIIAKSRDALRDALQQFSIRIASRTGTTIAVFRPVAEDLARTSPDVVVVNLGTNDVWWQLPVEQVVADFQAMLDLFPSACTVGVTVTEHGTPVWTPYRPTYNQALAAEFNVAVRARVDRVADWETAIASDLARYTGDDRIHPTKRGQRLLAQLIEDAVTACGA
jgi:lysophospholipase L1-like esterase